MPAARCVSISSMSNVFSQPRVVWAVVIGRGRLPPVNSISIIGIRRMSPLAERASPPSSEPITSAKVLSFPS